jgi:hypothetical protein
VRIGRTPLHRLVGARRPIARELGNLVWMIAFGIASRSLAWWIDAQETASERPQPSSSFSSL